MTSRTSRRTYQLARDNTLRAPARSRRPAATHLPALSGMGQVLTNQKIWTWCRSEEVTMPTQGSSLRNGWYLTRSPILYFLCFGFSNKFHFLFISQCPDSSFGPNLITNVSMCFVTVCPVDAVCWLTKIDADCGRSCPTEVRRSTFYFNNFH